MPNWLISLAVGAVIALVLLALSLEAFTIVALMIGWFVLVGGIALGGEMLIQALGRALRRSGRV